MTDECNEMLAEQMIEEAPPLEMVIRRAPHGGFIVGRLTQEGDPQYPHRLILFAGDMDGCCDFITRYFQKPWNVGA